MDVKHKGSVLVGNTVHVELSLDSAAGDVAHLFMAYGRVGGTPSQDSDSAAPGGFARTALDMDSRGRLRVLVDMSQASDTGILEVREGETTKHREQITGDTSWVYSVLDQ